MIKNDKVRAPRIVGVCLLSLRVYKVHCKRASTTFATRRAREEGREERYEREGGDTSTIGGEREGEGDGRATETEMLKARARHRAGLIATREREGSQSHSACPSRGESVEG